jgi:hypothetical protein
MEDFDQQLNKFSPTAKLFGLISNIPQEQLIKLLKQLLGEVFNKNLFRMVLELSEEQQRMLLQRLEGMKMEDGKIDRRGYQRKPCLISVNYTFDGRDHKGFILDISSFGVFIETRNSFPIGHEISMTFTVPNSQIPFQLTGEIVWSGLHGIGVKFKYLTQFQLEMIQSFSEKMEEVYDIIS